MNLMPEEIRALCEKFSALHDGQLDASEVAALEKVLHENQTARRLYVRYSRVCGGLNWDLSRTAEDVALFAPESTAMTPADAAAQQSTIILEGLADTGPSTLGMFVPFQPLAVLASAIGISILAVAALFIFGWPAPDGREPAIAVKGDQSPLEVKSVRLAEGTATILLPQVGYAIVEGPAEFDVVGPLRARLASGKIRVRVTEKSGRGFVLETPYGEIVDWGTEYAVDLQEKGRGGLVVFEGAVDLRVSESKAGDGAESVRNERLVGGEGVEFDLHGALSRIPCVFTGDSPTFSRNTKSAADKTSVITRVTDNLHSTNTKKFYEIVPGGLREDAVCYADRPKTQWNGVTAEGMPSYLIGADYVKPFNDDKMRKDFEMEVTLCRPAKLFIFFDDRLKTPDWLSKGFRKTGDKIGSDFGPWKKNTRNFKVADGAGVSIDATFTIWERVVSEAGTVTLGHNPGRDVHSASMYGIAAMALESSATSE